MTYSSNDIYNMRDIRNIIDENVWALEHKDKFKKCLDAIKSIRKRYIVVDSLRGEFTNVFCAYVEYGLYDDSDIEVIYQYDFMISYEELSNLCLFDITYTSELINEYETDDDESVELGDINY